MFYIVGLTDILRFAVPLYFAYRRCMDPRADKRFIHIATIALLTPAIARLPFDFVYRKPPVVAWLAENFLVILLWLRSTVYAPDPSGDAVGRLLVFVLQTRIPIGKTAAWHALAAWVQHLLRQAVARGESTQATRDN